MTLLLPAISQAPRLPSSCFWEAPLICWNILSRGPLLRAVFLKGVEMGGCYLCGSLSLSLSSHPQKTKSTFLRCAILLKWQFRKELFSKLAWGHGQSAENDIFVYMVRCRRLPKQGQGGQGRGDGLCAVRVLQESAHPSTL